MANKFSNNKKVQLFAAAVADEMDYVGFQRSGRYADVPAFLAGVPYSCHRREPPAGFDRRGTVQRRDSLFTDRAA